MQYKIVFALLVSVMLSSCGSESMRESYKEMQPDEMISVAKEHLSYKQYNLASEDFATFNELYPFHKEGESARILGIYSYFKDANYTQMIFETDYFQKMYPRSAHMDWILYMQSYAYYLQYRNWFQASLGSDRARNDIVSLQGTITAIQRLLVRYPDSQYVEPAKYLLARIDAIIAKENIDMAEFYYDRHAYVASANRLAHFLQTHPDSCMLPKATALLGKSYQKLGLDDWQKDIDVLRSINQF